MQVLYSTNNKKNEKKVQMFKEDRLIQKFKPRLCLNSMSFAPLMKCIRLYVTNLIRSVITDKDTGKCKLMFQFKFYFRCNVYRIDPLKLTF